MTILTTASKVTLNGNGATTVWPYAFEIPGDTSTDQSNVIVTLTDVSTGAQIVLTDNLYSITGINNPAGGNVTYPLSGTPLAAGNTITIERSIPYVQETNIPNQSAFYGTVLTNAYDYCMMCIQQLVTQLTYSIKFPITDTTPPAALPPAALRANGYLGFDAFGALAILGFPSGGGSGGGGGSWNYRNVTASTGVTLNDGWLLCDATSGPLTITLPDAADAAGHAFVFKKIDATASPVTIAGDANIDGQASFTLAQQYNALTILSDGIRWNIQSQL